jgi:hypothetical protein
MIANDTMSDLQVEVSEHQITVTREDRRYRVRGLAKNTSYDQMKINLMVTRDGALHVDTLDLYDARRRITFCKQAADELFVDEATVKQDLGHLLLQLEECQNELIESAQAFKSETPYRMTEVEEAAARQLLESPDLLDRIADDFQTCGVVGEQTNKLVGYLAATSRKLARPLAIVVQSSSAAGKSSLMDAVLSFIPPEDQVRVSAMTGQSLFYMGEDGLKHKVLAIAEDVGAEQASYALKLLQSDGHLTLTTTERNGDTGRHAAQTYRTEGPTSCFCTTTASDVDEELLNRSIVLTVDEGRASLGGPDRHRPTAQRRGKPHVQTGVHDKQVGWKRQEVGPQCQEVGPKSAPSRGQVGAGKSPQVSVRQHDSAQVVGSAQKGKPWAVRHRAVSRGP